MIALIDNDFVQHIAEIKSRKPEEKESIVRTVFQSLELQGKMHGLLYKHEFENMNNSQYFFDCGLFSVLALEDIFQDDELKREYYCRLVPELYRKMTGDELEIEDVLTKWKRRCSLGEVHSLAACMVGGYGIFLSDDRGSKSLNQIVRNEYKSKIAVYNRDELIQKLEPGILKKSDRNAFKHTS